MRLGTGNERAEVLRAYDILDTGPEGAFEDIVDIARAVTGAPIALVSLLDADRQWFKAARGAGDLREIPLDTSFCVLTVQEAADRLVIPDAALDPRTRAMALVAGEPRVRSYAGVPLRAPSGEPLGTVCVLDTSPRDFTEGELASLQALGRQTSALLELRRVAAERAATASKLHEASRGRELAMQAARLGRWDHHPPTGRRFYDPRAREILGVTGDDTSVATLLAALHPGDRPAVGAALAAVMRPDRTGPFDVQFRIGPAQRWVSCVGRTEFEDGVCTRFFGVVEDIDGRKRLEEHRAFLSDELNHRVKNILALAQSVADATLRAAPDVTSAREVLTGRLQALARAHDALLAQQWRAAPLRDVALATFEGAGVDAGRVELEGPPVELASRPALQLALALHELATNACKYGALCNDVGRVALRWSVGAIGEAPPRLHLAWAERGGPPVTPPVRTGFGARVTGRATEEAFGGTVSVVYAPAGLRWSLDAPMEGLGVVGP